MVDIVWQEVMPQIGMGWQIGGQKGVKGQANCGHGVPGG